MVYAALRDGNDLERNLMAVCESWHRACEFSSSRPLSMGAKFIIFTSAKSPHLATIRDADRSPGLFRISHGGRTPKIGVQARRKPTGSDRQNHLLEAPSQHPLVQLYGVSYQSATDEHGIGQCSAQCVILILLWSGFLTDLFSFQQLATGVR